MSRLRVRLRERRFNAFGTARPETALTLEMIRDSRQPLVAVVDTETTGFSPKVDRVVEVAALLTTLDGQVIDQYASLVNPQRHVSATEIHGLTATLLSEAPTFAELAPSLTYFLSRGSVVAGHNVRFDMRLLDAEFARSGSKVVERPLLCTMALAGGGRLAYCCELYGIPLRREVHDAREDVRATAQLLATLLRDDPSTRRAIAEQAAFCVDSAPALPSRTLSREEAVVASRRTPTAIQRLLERADAGGPYEDEGPSELAYANLLERALEDRWLSSQEMQALAELASTLEIDGGAIRSVHRRILERLIRAYLADAVLAQDEIADLQNVARLLGLSDELDAQVTAVKRDSLKTTPVSIATGCSLAGLSVCFTGEIEQAYMGRRVTREDVEALAAGAGLDVRSSVTKKLDLLVCADPATESGKAKKARLYGTRILHAAEFLRQLPAAAVASRA